MSKKIMGATVSTPLNPKRFAPKPEDGACLPEVFDDDEGKVLQVEGGEWVKKDMPQSEEIIFATNADIQNIFKKLR